LNPLDADLSYETRVSFIAAANQEILDEIMSQINKWIFRIKNSKSANSLIIYLTFLSFQ